MTIPHDLTAARARFDAGDLDGALALLDTLLEDAPEDVGLWSTRGLWLAEAGRTQAALAAFERSLAITPTYADHYNAGNMLMALGRLDEALAAFDASLALNDRYPQAWVNRGIVLHQRRQTEDAVQSFDRALSIDADFPPALRCKAIALQALRRPSDAEDLYQRLVELQPDQPGAWRDLALALSRLAPDGHLELHPRGREWRALEALNRAIAAAPDASRLWHAKSNVLARVMHANRAFRTISPDDGRFVYVQGPLRTSSFFEEQLALCEDAKARFPDAVWPWINLARAHDFAGDEALATTELAEALRRDPKAEGWARSVFEDDLVDAALAQEG